MILTGRFRSLLVFKGMVLQEYVSGAMFGIILGHIPPQPPIIGLLRMLRAKFGPLMVQLTVGFVQYRLPFSRWLCFLRRRLCFLRRRLLPTSCMRYHCLTYHLWSIHTRKTAALIMHLLIICLFTDMPALVLYRRVALLVITELWCLGLGLDQVPLQISHWCCLQRHQL